MANMQKRMKLTVTTSVTSGKVSTKSLFLLAVLAPWVASAADWNFQPRIELGQNWTDNVALEADGLEDSEWITELSPGFILSLEGPRVSAEVDYQMQILRFSDNSDLDDVFNRLTASGEAELFPETTFVDVFARYDQQNVDTSGRQAFSNFFSTDNRTDFIVLGVSPYHQGAWGNWGESLVRVTAYGVQYRNTDTGATPPVDSDNIEVIATLGSPDAAPGFSWRTSGSYTGTNFDSGEDFKYAQTLLDVSQPLGFRTRVTGRVGLESDVATDLSKGGLDESLWMVGFNWEPSDLQSLEVRGGDRFYGTAWEASWQRRGSKGELAVDYTEDPTTSSGVLSDDSMFLPGFPTIDLGSLDNRVFLQKRLSGRASYELTRSVIEARVYTDRREFLDVMGGKEDSAGFTLRFDWEASTRTSFGAVANLEKRKFELNREDDYAEASVRITRQINRVLEAEVRLSHFLRNSNVEDDYSANLIALYLTATFGHDSDATPRR